jgi:hypothetical protein
MIRPSEIKSVEEIGTLENSPVKMIRTIGGLWVATGRPRGRKDDEAIAAGSHPAIVKHNIEKTFGQNYQPHMHKSEGAVEPKVLDHTSKLEKSLIDKGYTLHSVQADTAVDFILSKSGVEVLKHEALVKSDSVEFNGTRPNSQPHIIEALKNGVTQSFILAAYDLGKESIVYKGTTYKVR